MHTNIALTLAWIRDAKLFLEDYPDPILSEADTCDYFRQKIKKTPPKKIEAQSLRVPAPSSIQNPLIAATPLPLPPKIELPPPVSCEAPPAAFINSPQGLTEQSEVRSKRSRLNEEDMVSAMVDEEDRSAKAIANRSPDEPGPKDPGLAGLDRVSNSAQAFGFELPGPKGPGFWRPDEFMKGAVPPNLPPISQPLPPKKRENLVGLRALFSKIAPEVPILHEIPSDAMAKKIASRWKTKNQIASITLISYQENPEHKQFLEQIVKALDVYFGPAKLLVADTIEREKEWKTFLSAADLKLVIACDYTLWQLQNLCQFYKEIPAQKHRQLGEKPLFMLPDLSLYLKDPLLKRSLWKALCQTICSLPSPSIKN